MPSKAKVKSFPRYLRLGSSCLIREKVEKGAYYHKSYGSWGVWVKVVKGKFIAVSSHKHLDGRELVEVSREEWVYDNGIERPSAGYRILHRKEASTVTLSREEWADILLKLGPSDGYDDLYERVNSQVKVFPDEA